MTTKIDDAAALLSPTAVLNTGDGEPGSILSAVAYDAARGEWTEYEVVTRYGIETWRRDEFILMSEAEAALADAR